MYENINISDINVIDDIYISFLASFYKWNSRTINNCMLIYQKGNYMSQTTKQNTQYKSQNSSPPPPSSEFHLVRDYSRLAYKDLSLDLKFVASRCASGVQDNTVLRHTLALARTGDEREKERESEESCGRSCDIAVSYREKLPYHANPGTSPKHLRSGATVPHGYGHGRWRVARLDKS